MAKGFPATGASGSPLLRLLLLPSLDIPSHPGIQAQLTKLMSLTSACPKLQNSLLLSLNSHLSVTPLAPTSSLGCSDSFLYSSVFLASKARCCCRFPSVLYQPSDREALCATGLPNFSCRPWPGSAFARARCPPTYLKAAPANCQKEGAKANAWRPPGAPGLPRESPHPPGPRPSLLRARPPGAPRRISTPGRPPLARKPPPDSGQAGWWFSCRPPNSPSASRDSAGLWRRPRQ